MGDGKVLRLLDYLEAQKLLEKYGIETVRSAYVSDAEDAVLFSRGKPIVLKVISQQALHKSKSGLVKLGLSKPEEIRSAFSYLAKQAHHLTLKQYKVLAQEMVPSGIEIIIGGRIDQQFGKLLLLGLGGVYVETFKDISLRVCPITKYDAASMLYQLRSRKVIAPDERAENRIESLLMKVSKMLVENSISELDLNPVILRADGYNAVDLRILK
ncbi:MAG: acetate--CoA ligase family protein [Candidatus Micrarchaeaceae archaeon]